MELIMTGEVLVKVDGRYRTFKLSDKFEQELYGISGRNTFAFISRELHAQLSPKAKAVMNCDIDEEEELTPEEILAKNVMYILVDSDTERDDVLSAVRLYTGVPVNYLEIVRVAS